jgi:hypothetical protein
MDSEQRSCTGGFEEACREKVAFFVDDGLVGSRDPVSGCRVLSTSS